MTTSVAGPRDRGPTVFATALFLASLLVGTRSLVPLIWNDSTSYLNSAVQSVAHNAYVVTNGVNVGYVAVLAAVLGTGAGLGVVVLLQQLAWAASVSLCGYTLLKITHARGVWLAWFAVPLLLMATYPGIQIYNNIIMTEALYTASLTSALCFALLAWSSKTTPMALLHLVAAVAAACFAALTKAQGLAAFGVIATATLCIAARLSWKAVAILAVLLALSAALIWQGQLLRERNEERTSALFGSKTLFCLHLDLVLDAQSTSRLAQSTFGSSSPVIMARLNHDFQSRTGAYKTLGFYADDCQFDTELDSLGIAANVGGVAGLAAWYRQAFLDSIVENPFRYARKVVKQLLYGLKMAMPPHALGSTVDDVQERRMTAIEIVNRFAPNEARLSREHLPVSAPLVGHYPAVANFVYRGFSLMIAAALIASLAASVLSGPRQKRIVLYAALSSLVWLSNIASVALTHTLDIWRYIVPVVPVGIVSFSLAAYWIWDAAVRPAIARLRADGGNSQDCS